MFVLYEVALYLAFIVAIPYFLLIGILRGKYLSNLRSRLGNYPGRAQAHDLWIHAVSVGETLAARPVVEQLLKLRPRTSLVITTTTLTGQAMAERSYPQATVAYFPFDFSFAVNRFLDHHRPTVLVVIETEIWPNVTRLASARGLKLLLINGRISDHSFTRYRAVRAFLKPVLSRYDAILARERVDGDRFVAIGAPSDRVEVCGNIKFDFLPEDRELEFLPQLHRMMKGRPLFVAGSTMEGEDEQLVAAMSRFIHDLGCFIVVAPRRPERFNVVAHLLDEAGIRFARRSELDVLTTKEGASGAGDVLLLDSIGELASVYQHAVAAFVGGSLVPNGGHNPIEPVAAGAPVAFGPYMSNFREIASIFLRDEASVEVRDMEDLVAFVQEMVENPRSRAEFVARGRQTIETNQGAAKRAVDKITEALDASNSASR